MAQIIADFSGCSLRLSCPATPFVLVEAGNAFEIVIGNGFGSADAEFMRQSEMRWRGDY